jgi:transcriptional regulator with XRE-family HTH domain
VDIGHRIRELREAREFTVRVLSDRTGLAENSIARIERGERMPSASSVEAIARGLGVAPGELFEEPALAGKAEAPLETGDGEERRHRERVERVADFLGWRPPDLEERAEEYEHAMEKAADDVQGRIERELKRTSTDEGLKHVDNLRDALDSPPEEEDVG